MVLWFELLVVNSWHTLADGFMVVGEQAVESTSYSTHR
tara:strand:- start:353 stop:466 length:114 start_codon:yes stop_codon:yes gene_type:complete